MRFAHRMFPPRSSPRRSPHGRPTPPRCAFWIAKATRFSADRKPPADRLRRVKKSLASLRRDGLALAHLEDLELVAQSPQLRGPGGRSIARFAEHARDLRAFDDWLGREDRARVGQLVHARGDVDSLAKIVLPIVEHDGEARTRMQPDIQRQVLAATRLVDF